MIALRRRLQHVFKRKLWALYIARLERWRGYCRARTCPGCGYERKKGKARWLCPCETEPTREQLVMMIRRIAGISDMPHSSVRSEWTGWSSGLPGFQSCGPASWDNAVRAHDE